MADKKSFFSETQSDAIVNEISIAEAQTSGELRLHIEPHCSKDAMERAIEVFNRLGMNQTAQANGVLIYMAYNDKKFAIIGDKGINAVVPANFWEAVKDVMQEHFKKGEFFEGVVFAIRETGNHLKQYFPLAENDKNELPNDISED